MFFFYLYGENFYLSFIYTGETHGDHCTLYKWSKIREKINYTKSNKNNKKCVGKTFKNSNNHVNSY